MSFEEGALARLRRYRGEADRSLGLVRETEEAARRFSERLFGVIDGAAAETDEDLMHEELSRYVLDPSGYSGRILGFSQGAGEEPCQIFAVYRDGVWKTRGIFVERARGKIEDPDEVLNGFCLRIFGRLIDLAVPTGGSGRRWERGQYTLADILEDKRFPTRTRWFK